MSAAAVTALRRKRLIRRFREAGATDPEHALTLEALGQPRTWIFDQMLRAGVFQPASGGAYYMDQVAASHFRHRYRMRALMITAVCALLFLVLWLTGVLGR